MIDTCSRLNSSGRRLGSEGISIKSKLEMIWGSLEEELRGKQEGAEQGNISLEHLEWITLIFKLKAKQSDIAIWMTLFQYGFRGSPEFFLKTCNAAWRCHNFRSDFAEEKKKLGSGNVHGEIKTESTSVLSISMGSRKLYALILMEGKERNNLIFILDHCLHSLGVFVLHQISL